MDVLDRLKSNLDEEIGVDQDALLTELLNRAKDEILQRLYPFDSTVTALPARYITKQIKIAEFLYNKRGAEGETAHSENGVSRSYESGDIPASMFTDIVPMVGVPE